MVISSRAYRTWIGKQIKTHSIDASVPAPTQTAVQKESASELSEGLGRCLVLRYPENVEAYGFRQRSALACIEFEGQDNLHIMRKLRTDSDNIANFNTESGRHVRRQVLVPLLVTVCNEV